VAAQVPPEVTKAGGSAVLTLLNDEEWGKWSDNQIAQKCGVSHPFVGSIRAITSEPRTYTTAAAEGIWARSWVSSRSEHKRKRYQVGLADTPSAGRSLSLIAAPGRRRCKAAGEKFCGSACLGPIAHPHHHVHGRAFERAPQR
jgi:hypothetical protein